MILKTKTILQRIIRHPSNKGQVPIHILHFWGWQLFKRLIGCPIVVVSCGKRFLAYPDCTFSSMLMYFNIPEYIEQSILKSHSHDGKAIFFDIGANIGFYSIVIGDYFSAVHAFEPNPKALRRLRENTMLNELNVIANNFALSDKEGLSHLCVGSNVDPMAYLQEVSAENTISVPVLPLDIYIKKNQIKEKIVAKIDVEGGELNVLQGAIESLREKCFSIIQFESLDEKNFTSITKFIKSVGYDVYTASNTNLFPVEHRINGVNNYYLLPSEN